LEKVTAVEHVNVQHKEREQTQLETQEDVHETLAAVPPPAFAEHDAVHGNIAPDIVVTDMEQTAPLPLDTKTMAHTIDTNANDDTDVEIKNDNIMQPLRVTPAQHRQVQISKNIQSDLDLWARVREYDQQTAEEGFTQVLSKKQQQAKKKQVLGKLSYNTRTRGGPSPSA